MKKKTFQAQKSPGKQKIKMSWKNSGKATAEFFNHKLLFWKILTLTLKSSKKMHMRNNMLTFKWHSQERSCRFSPKKVNAFEMHLEQKLHAKCKINSF